MLKITNTFGTIENPRIEKRHVAAEIVTAKKDQNNIWRPMRWCVWFVGDAFEKAQELTNYSKIKINSGICELYGDNPMSISEITGVFAGVKITVFDFETIEWVKKER